MTEQMLLIAFISFAVLLLITVFVLRNRSVQDVLDNKDISSLKEMDSSPPEIYEQSKLRENKPIASGSMPGSGFELNRENINRIGKVLSVIGAIALFIPAPDYIRFLGLFLLFLGSIISKTTKPDNKKKKTISQN